MLLSSLAALLHHGIQQQDRLLWSRECCPATFCMAGASLSLRQASQRDKAEKKYADEALSAPIAVLSKGTGKCSSTQIHMAQNNLRHSGIKQEQTARERCRLCILSNFCPCDLRAHAVERWKKEKGLSMAKGRYSDVTVFLFGPCSPIYKSFASHRLLPTFLLHAHISVCHHMGYLWSLLYGGLNIRLCLVPSFADAHCWIQSVALRWCSIPRAAAFPLWCSKRADHPQRVYSPWLTLCSAPSAMWVLPAVVFLNTTRSYFIISKYDTWNTSV